MAEFTISDAKNLAILLCDPIKLMNKTLNVAPYIYELTKIIREYCPTLYYCDDKLISGCDTNKIMRIQTSKNGDIFMTNFRQIYSLKQLKNNIYKNKAKKLLLKKKPYFHATPIATTQIFGNFEVDGYNNVYFIMPCGFFREAMYVLKPDKSGDKYQKPKRIHTFKQGEGNRIFCVNNYGKNKNNTMLLCRDLNKFIAMKYNYVKHNCEIISEWKIGTKIYNNTVNNIKNNFKNGEFNGIEWIQWLNCYTKVYKKNYLLFGMTVDWPTYTVIIYGILLLNGIKKNKNISN